MEKFKKTWSLKKRKDTTGSESSKPHQWKEDEKKVREGSCSFQVKYLGCIEVFESRGIQVCEEAVKALKSVCGRRLKRSIWSRLSLRRPKKKSSDQQGKSNHHVAMLYVTGDALRVVEEISKGLIVDQTIEKVSFCAPDRDHDKGFAYICRDGTTRRWMCHGFLAVKESGERLSHAVGCAFAICLEKKQQREKEKVSVLYSDNGSTFSRMGSFKQTSLTERLTDPQSAIVAEPVPVKPASNPYAVSRPRASAEILERQGSFNSFQKLADSSPFKRNVSLRLNELPSNLERQHQFSGGFDGPQSINERSLISTIIESDEGEAAEPSSTTPSPTSQALSASTTTTVAVANSFGATTATPTTTTPAAQALPAFSSHHSTTTTASSLLTQQQSVTQGNPWNNDPNKATSEAENWLNSTANTIDPFAAAPNNSALIARSQHNVTTPTPIFNQSYSSLDVVISQNSPARHSYYAYSSQSMSGPSLFNNASIITPHASHFPQQQQQNFVPPSQQLPQPTVVQQQNPPLLQQPPLLLQQPSLQQPQAPLQLQQPLQQPQQLLLQQQLPQQAMTQLTLQQQIEQQQLIIQKLQEQLKLHDIQQEQQLQQPQQQFTNQL